VYGAQNSSTASTLSQVENIWKQLRKKKRTRPEEKWEESCKEKFKQKTSKFASFFFEGQS
jgi:hypothetical protein